VVKNKHECIIFLTRPRRNNVKKSIFGIPCINWWWDKNINTYSTYTLKIIDISVIWRGKVLSSFCSQCIKKFVVVWYIIYKGQVTVKWLSDLFRKVGGLFWVEYFVESYNRVECIPLFCTPQKWHFCHILTKVSFLKYAVW